MIVIFTLFKCVFMAISTPTDYANPSTFLPVMVPLIIVPFFSSIVTVSVVSFIRNLIDYGGRMERT